MYLWTTYTYTAFQSWVHCECDGISIQWTRQWSFLWLWWSYGLALLDTRFHLFCPYPTDFMSHYVQLVMITTSTKKKNQCLLYSLLLYLRLNLDDSSAMIMMTVNSIVDHICTFHLFSASSNKLILFFSRQNGQSTHAYSYFTSPYLSV